MHLLNRYIICCALALFCTTAFGRQTNLQFVNPYLRIPVLKAGEDPVKTFNSLVFLRVVASKNSVYAGEAFLVEYKLYRAISTDPSPGKQPAFFGCSVLELSPVTDTDTETLAGKQYHVNILRKVQLTALQEGHITLDEASVNNIVQFYTSDNPNQAQSIRLEAKSIPDTIEVKPLPEKDKPAGFTGVVGNFNMVIKADTNTVPAGENSHLTVIVRGTGDIAGVPVPAVNWPANIEHFEATATQHLQRDSFPAGGEKAFSVPFIGPKEGIAVIPPVYFAFFNPGTQKYDSVHTDSLSIRFTKALPKKNLQVVFTEDITNRKYLWIVPAIALMVVFVVIITGKTQRKEKRRRRQTAVEQKKPLPLTLPPIKKTDFTAEVLLLSAIKDDQVFFSKAKELLTQALRQKLNSFAFYEADILQELQSKSHNKTLVATVQQIYKICNQNLYSPILNSEQRETLQKALDEVIRQLEV